MIWIKLYVDILQDFKFLELTDRERYIFIGLILVAVKNDNLVPNRSDFISHSLATSNYHLSQILTKLEKLGLISIKLLADCYQNAIPIREDKIRRDAVSKIATSPKSPHQEIISFFISQVKERKGFEPEISWAKEGKLLKQKLVKYTPDKLKDLIAWYLDSKHSEKLGTSLAVCLSAHIINLWLEDTT